jgi:hypothetical protein
VFRQGKHDEARKLAIEGEVPRSRAVRSSPLLFSGASITLATYRSNRFPISAEGTKRHKSTGLDRR